MSHNLSIDSQRLLQLLDDPAEATRWLTRLGLRDRQRGLANLASLSQQGLTIDLLLVLVQQLDRELGRLSDPDMALNNLDRFFASARSPLSLGSLFERDEDALPTLLQIFSTSQYLSDILVRDPDSFDLLRLTEGQPVSRQILVEEICGEVAALADERLVMNALRRFKQRETLRIAYGDIVRGQTIDTVTRQISLLAEAICEAAVMVARRELEGRRGTPRRARDGRPARFVVLALGKLGGAELNYSSDIDLIFLSDGEGQTDGPRSQSNQEFFDRLARNLIKLLTEATELGVAYRVDMRLRPDGRQGTAVIGEEAALRYYDLSGRTWERQAFVKARAIAGDLDLGLEFLSKLEPWIYRRYLTRADITGIKALKRRIEQRASREGGDLLNVKTGHGGIRDIEFVIQFLQLLNGGDLPEIRTGNTIAAIAGLEQAQCLTMQERSILEQNYAFLRKIEHRLQIMFDLQTHTLPDDEAELARLAKRLGFATSSPLAEFQVEFQDRTSLNRKILDHLLHDAFQQDEQAEPEVDLVLDPSPSNEVIRQILGPYGFQDVEGAYANLMELSRERIPFLSTRRCRHFLAAIAPRLLGAIKATPEPDLTLVNLSQVSDSLGGKGILWELFSFNPPSLHLYVQLCASSPYLSGILTSNPGMIDELMDSLVLDRLPTQLELSETLAELCKGAEDVEPILHSFKNSHHLRVGVRDILGKDDIQVTHRALANIAEVCLRQVARLEYEKLVARYGVPMTPAAEGGGDAERACSLVILAMGKLGGQEPNYHSDLDVVFLFEADGQTRHHRAGRGETTSNQHFFAQLGQRIIKVFNQLGPHGRLYELDPRLRPTGKSGALAVSVAEFRRYFASGEGQLWERQALCKARIVFGSETACRAVREAVLEAVTGVPWAAEHADAIRAMRYRLEETATPRNLKRGRGGTVDVEFAVQMLQLAHAKTCPEVLVPGTLAAIEQFDRLQVLPADQCRTLESSYRFLRSIEAGLRLMNTTARHDLPGDPAELARLAYLLGHESGQTLIERCETHMQSNRQWFESLFARYGTLPQTTGEGDSQNREG